MSNSSVGRQGGSGGLAGATAMLVMLAIANAFNFGDRVLLGVVQEPLRAEFHLDDFQMGLLGGPAFALLYTFMGFPLARLAERHNRVTIISLALAGWSFMTLLGGMASNFVQLFLARMGVSIGEAGCAPPSHSLISDYYPPDRRTNALALYSIGAPFGSVLMGLMGGYIGQHYGWRAAFISAGAAGIAVAIVLRLIVREVRVPAAGPARHERFWEAVRFLWAKPSFRQTCVGGAVAGFGSFFMLQYLSAFLVRIHGMTLASAGLVVGIAFGLSSVLGTWIAGALAQKLSRKNPRWLLMVPATGLALAGVAFALAYLAGSATVVVSLVVLAAIFLNFYQAPSFAVAQAVATPTMRATSAAVYLFCVSFVGMGLGPPVLGAVSDFAATFFLPSGMEMSSCAAAAADPACALARAEGLRVAMIAASATMVWASLHYWLARKTIAADSH